MFDRFPDFHVDSRSVVADNDMVIAWNMVWHGIQNFCSHFLWRIRRLS